MIIEFTYADTPLQFSSEEEVGAWCDKHIDLFSGVNLSSRGQEEGAAVFRHIKGRLETSNPLNGFRGSLPPILEEPAGRFFAKIKVVDPIAFEAALAGWKEFGRDQLGPLRNVTSGDVVQLSLIYAARVSVDPVEAAYLNSLIKEQRAAVSKLHETQRRFEEFMTLKSPADYWKSKQSEHHGNRVNFRKLIGRCGLGYLVAMVLIPIVCLVYGVGPLNELLADASVPLEYAFYPLVGLYFLLGTVGLWGLRVLVKIYLSEHHLFTDARERQAMVQTYHALSALGETSREDRDIVLAALFRPTQDGVVKDDGIDPTLPGLLSRALTK